MGDVITLLYNTGTWPTIASNGTWLNGGVPQNGNVSLHLETLEIQLRANI